MTEQRAEEWRALARLATDATLGVTDVVEGVHQAIWGALGFRGPVPGRTGGITGLVYRQVRAITALAGSGAGHVAALAAELAPLPAGEAARPAHWLAILNGIMGDRLHAMESPLAIPMSLQDHGDALASAALPQAPVSKLLLLIHGLCMNEFGWQSETNYGEMLARERGYTPLYLRYNSGRAVADNAQALARLLEDQCARWPQARISVLSHSMGGLLIRSAINCANEAQMAWPKRLDHLVFLGTPHHGAPLERTGNWVDTLLAQTPISAPLAKLGHLRSAGITDLRYGQLSAADSDPKQRFARQPDRRRHAPLPAGVNAFTVAATLTEQGPRGLKGLLGDGLVPLSSALGRHRDPARGLDFGPEQQMIAWQTGHLQLLNSKAVAEQLLRWL